MKVMPGTVEFDLELLRKEKNDGKVDHLVKSIKELLHLQAPGERVPRG